uniref:Ground-like domain-containing protein n=1 Tax=Caenorhabditis tropicalis TaxID=1561998 RepID=A0A1I7UZU9_9PELO
MVLRRILISTFLFIYTCFVVSVPIVPTTEEGEKFSAAPNNTPISKVYIFGRPVYIREPFVVPQRNSTEQIDFSKLFDTAKQRKHRASYVDEPVYAANKGGAYVTNKYPLKQCYTERSGYMCCNLRLENVMHDTAVKMKESKSCNLQKMATMLANITESVFGTDFEAISARDGRTLLVYATPDRHNYAVPERHGYPTYTPYTL